MTDIKSFGGRARRKPKQKQRRVGRNYPLIKMPLNEMVIRWSAAAGTLTTSTTGTIAFSEGFSIANSSEYSVLQSLFTEVRLVSANIVFSATGQTIASLVQGDMVIGTNLIENTNSMVVPTSATPVQNLTRFTRINTFTASRKPFIYRAYVPNNLEFASLTADSPSTVTPWAGSPGTVKGWADALTVSTVYFKIQLQCIHHLRGRV